MKYDEQYWFDQDEVNEWREERKALGLEYKDVSETLAARKSTASAYDISLLKERRRQLEERCKKLNEKIKAVDLLRQQEKLIEYEIDPRDGRGLIASAVGLITRLKLEIRKHDPKFYIEGRDLLLFNTMELYAQHNVRSVPTKVAFVKEQVEY